MRLSGAVSSILSSYQLLGSMVFFNHNQTTTLDSAGRLAYLNGPDFLEALRRLFTRLCSRLFSPPADFN